MGLDPPSGTCFHVLCPLLATYFATPEMSETLGISGVARAEQIRFWPNISKVAFMWLPKQVMANALKTPKCIDFYLMMLEAEGSDGERVSNGSDRNQDHLCLRFNSLDGF